MNVYFSTTLSKYRKLLPLTSDIARIIEDLGHTVTSKHVIKEETTEGEWQTRYNPEQLFEREMRRLATADVLITEATTPSYGAGFLIQSALVIGKPVLTLHYGEDMNKVPLMLRGHRLINLHLYTEDTIRPLLKKFLEEVKVIEPLEDFDQ